ncbi:prepilin-type N-terminal cleavage/methylation domain-containing protein [Caloramator sp. E03]|uniref:prepilin-type N-terminal cleavage/methylation domain-containing protein n=1 Tax=Caloramator sp. E03 TaxID=2576307 RepID=UPI0011105256|nr:prepilin-type N-terminal cleavage/methylation domain-containing protein [Caloramator sp. E03]QCX32671.1 prepilin-type N-terminal cleavage/methylation domain-containing protein [Caloramator sp. E03]
MNKRNKKKGFTLIEMIVVVAIIAILAGIAVPQVTKQINNSKKTSDIANAKTIANMIQQKIAEGESVTETIDANGNTSGYKLVDNTQFDTVPEVKFLKGYKFYYQLNITNNELNVGVAKTTDVSNTFKILYPSVDADYK